MTGRFVPAVHLLFDYAWFTGFFVSGAVYLGLMRGVRQVTEDKVLAAEEA
jgi:cytosine/uracil/thiamine/allantoin permease